MKNNIFLIIFFLIVLGVVVYTPSLAQQPRFETELPGTTVEWDTVSVESQVPTYIKEIIRILSIFAGVIAFFSLAYGGFLWITSSGEPLKIQKSRSRIIHALVGLVFVFTAVTLANSIDPKLTELVEVQIEEVRDYSQSGIYLSSDGSFYENNEAERMNKVRKVIRSERTLGSFAREGSVKAVRIQNPKREEGRFLTAIVLHEEEDFKGRCVIYYNSNEGESTDIVIPTNVGENFTSISVLRINPNEANSYGHVKVYDKPDLVGNEKDLNKLQYTFTSLSDFQVWSIDIEGSYAVILADNPSWDTMTQCVVFQGSRPIPTLVGHPMNQCRPFFRGLFWAAYQSCAEHYANFPLFESR